MVSLPLEILIKIGEFIPRDSMMMSPTATHMHEVLRWYDVFTWHFKDFEDVSFYDFYFKHGYNHKYKYSYEQYLNFIGEYPNCSDYSDSDSD